MRYLRERSHFYSSVTHQNLAPRLEHAEAIFGTMNEIKCYKNTGLTQFVLFEHLPPIHIFINVIYTILP